MVSGEEPDLRLFQCQDQLSIRQFHSAFDLVAIVAAAHLQVVDQP